MASFVYTHAKYLLATGAIDFTSDDMRVLIVMTNTTADTEKDVEFVDDFTTLDEYDGSSYARKALASEAVNQDDANDRAEFDATDIQWATLGAGTRQAQAMVLIKHVTDDTDSLPIAYIDTGGFPFSGNGGNVDVTWNAEGILQLT